MKIDTKKRVIAIQLRRLLTLVGVVALAIGIILLGKLPNTFLGLNKYHWAIVVGVLYVIAIVIESLFQYTYINYYDEKGFIVFRFFSLGFFNKKKQSIEIPIKEFSSFVLKDFLFGKKKKIILRRYYKDVEAKYPAVSLSILTKEQLAQLLYALNALTKIDKK